MEEKDIISIVENYLRNHGYLPKRLTPNLIFGQKTPDFEVFEDNKLSYLTEVKTGILLPNPVTNMFHWNTTISKIREHTSKAHKQFADYDKNHHFPWLLFFTSSHFQLNWSNMLDSLRGSVVRGGKVINDLRSQRFVRNTEKEVKEIDLYVWLQVNGNDKRIYQFVNFVNTNSNFIGQVKTIIKKLTPYEEENIYDMNTKKYKGNKEKDLKLHYG